MHAFSPKNPLFCTFLQGGGTTFWQAQKPPFFGILGSRERPRPRPNFAPCANPKIDLLQLRNIRIGYKKNIYIFLYPPFTK
jgi:hypothetical protein